MAGRGRPFGEGNPGNQSGRPRGARNRATMALEAILEGDGEALTRKAIELALEGDGPALRLCLDRLMPVRKDRPIRFSLPTIETATDLTKATSALLKGVADGEITPSEAAELAKLIDAHVKALTAVDLDARIAALEQPTGARR